VGAEGDWEALRRHALNVARNNLGGEKWRTTGRPTRRAAARAAVPDRRAHRPADGPSVGRLLDLTHPGKLSKGAKGRIKDDIDAKHRRHGWRPSVLEEGMTVHEMGMPLKDQQFVEMNQFSATQVAVMFDVPPSWIGGATGDSLEYKTVEGQALNFVKFKKTPRLVRIERTLRHDKDLFPDRDLFPKFNVEGLLRGDSAARARFLHRPLRRRCDLVGGDPRRADMEVREDGERLIFQGHAAVFDRLSEDLGGFRERIQRGAFRKVLDANPTSGSSSTTTRSAAAAGPHDERHARAARGPEGAARLRRARPDHAGEGPAGAREARRRRPDELRVLDAVAGEGGKDVWTEEDGGLVRTIVSFSGCSTCRR
jgi:hypothetical protein